MKKSYIDKDPEHISTIVHHDYDSDEIRVQSYQDLEPVVRHLDRMRQVRGKDVAGLGRYVGHVPYILIEQWAEEDGKSLLWFMRLPRREKMKWLMPKLAHSDFSKLRVDWGKSPDRVYLPGKKTVYIPG